MRLAQLHLELYCKPGCHLCEDLRSLCERMSDEFSVQLTEVNVEADPVLWAQYGQAVPVLFINGRKAVKFRTSERELRRILRFHLLRQRLLGG